MSTSTRESEFRSATHHLERTAQNTTEDVAEPQSALDRLFRELDKLRQRVLVQREREVRLRPRRCGRLLLLLLVSLPTRGGARPWRGRRRLRVRDGGGDVQKRLEADLYTEPVKRQGRGEVGERYLCDDLASLLEVRTAPEIAARKKVLDQTRADVVAHLLELLVHLGVVLVVLYELHDERAVSHREQLCVLLTGIESAWGGWETKNALSSLYGPSIGPRRWL